MKHLLAVLCAMLVSVPAFAAGGFTGPGSPDFTRMPERMAQPAPMQPAPEVATPGAIGQPADLQTLPKQQGKLPAAAKPQPRGEKKPGSAQARGGFKGPLAGIEGQTVAQAIALHDDALVSLTGYIVARKAGTKKYYIFRDSTGEIIAEISRKRFRNQIVTPETLVRITGHVDKEEGPRVEVDVRTLEVLKR